MELMSGDRRGVVLADDATGALECASILAGLRHEVTISLGPWPVGRPWSGILVVDLESRHLPEELVRQLVGGCVEGLAPDALYLKTDSTLRGPIAVSLLEVMVRARTCPVVYVPAYPKLGRTVRDGRLLVDGLPLEQTAFARDVRHPARSSYLQELFAGEAREHVVNVTDVAALKEKLLTGHREILVCDAGTDADLGGIADALRAAGKGAVVAGPSGFVAHWASLAGFATRPQSRRPTVSKWLVVCGSLHPQSRLQLARAAQFGVETLASDSTHIMEPAQAARELAAAVVARVAAHKPQAILIMGGDTAFEVWKALGVTVLEPLAEVLPGIAACRSPGQDLVFVTKAGGFGDDSLVQQVIGKFQ